SFSGGSGGRLSKKAPLIAEGNEDITRKYIQGDTIDWKQLYKGIEAKRVSLPLYPFERHRCWIDIPVFEDHTGQPMEGKLFFDMEWVEEELQLVDSSLEENGKDISSGVTIVINDDVGIGPQITRRLQQNGRDVLSVTIGSSFMQESDHSYHIDGSEAHYEKLLLTLGDRPVRTIIFMSSMDYQAGSMSSLSKLQRTQKRGSYNLFHLTKMLLKHYSTEKIQYIVIADYVNHVLPDEKKIKPENAPLFGLAHAIDQECENITTRCIDVDDSTKVDDILTEINIPKQQRTVAYRNNLRYCERFAPVEMEDVRDNKIDIKADGVYLITGGTGGIGLEMGNYLAAKKPGVNIALINRSEMPPPLLWDEILDREEEKRTCKKIESIRDMEDRGAAVCLYSADCSNRSQMKKVLDDLREKFGKINGIIHSAGVEGEGLLVRKSEKKFSNVLNPKVSGTWILDRLTRNDDLDFFVLFSTVATFLMNPGQTDYTAANAFLDAFSVYRNMQGKNTLAVNWVTWKETGMAVNFNANFDIIFKAIPTVQAIDAFDTVLNKKLNRVLIGELNIHSKLINLLKNAQFRLARPIAGIIETPDQPAKSQVSDEKRKKVKAARLIGREDGNYSKSELLVAQVWGEVLGFDELRIDDNFYELGGDSILATQVVNRINTQNNLKISLIEIFNYETIRDLAQYVESLS
ncbi:MAG: SDR family NAD(P)-dependent oxidoreductase, partial [bacterium]|nr:SDR family NAD(P)-dependent oxidoreductase [bacterium]